MLGATGTSPESQFSSRVYLSLLLFSAESEDQPLISVAVCYQKKRLKYYIDDLCAHTARFIPTHIVMGADLLHIFDLD